MTTAVFFGSRSWLDLQTIEEVIDQLILGGDGSLVGIHGDAPGLDRLVDGALKRRGFSPTAVPAAWETHDRAGRTPVPCRCPEPRPNDRDHCRGAGYRRNQLIIDEHLTPAIERGEACWVVGFKHGDHSPGTDDMRRRLKPLVTAGAVRGIFRTGSGAPPAERRRGRPAPPAPSAEGAWPPPPWPNEVS